MKRITHSLQDPSGLSLPEIGWLGSADNLMRIKSSIRDDVDGIVTVNGPSQKLGRLIYLRAAYRRRCGWSEHR